MESMNGERIARLIRAYDVRGTTDELTVEAVRRIAEAYAALLQDQGIPHDHIVIGHDQRRTSPAYAREVARVMQRVAPRVSMLGLVPTPLVYHAVYTGFASVGIMITASHLPEAYNGLKFVHAGRKMLPAELDLLRDYARAQRTPRGDVQGEVRSVDYVERYVEDLLTRFTPRKPATPIILDTGNGTAGPVLRHVFNRLGWNVDILYEEPLPGNPNHLADPSVEETLDALKRRVRETSGMGFALDGDADRLGVVDEQGARREADMLIATLATSLAPLAEQHGRERRVVVDVKASQALIERVERAGIRIVMERTGHIHVEKRMREENAYLAGEASGHVFNNTLWHGFDDAIATLLTLLHAKPTSTPLSAWIPHNPYTLLEGKAACEDAHGRVERIAKRVAADQAGRVTRIDGIRAAYDDGWLLIRASNTEPVITWRVEGFTREAAERLARRVKALLREAGCSGEA